MCLWPQFDPINAIRWRSRVYVSIYNWFIETNLNMQSQTKPKIYTTVHKSVRFFFMSLKEVFMFTKAAFIW